MKTKSLLSLCLLSFFGVAAVSGATLTATESSQASGSLTTYRYQFSISGANAGINTVFLGSNDLSPLNVAITVDGAATSNWSFLGNNTPQNYLEFFSTNGSSLNTGDSLGVTFASIFGPGSSQFALAENSVTAAVTNEVTGLVGPTSSSTSVTPEPTSAGLLLAAGTALLAIGTFKGLQRRRA